MVECLVENGFMFSQKSKIFGGYIISVIFSPAITNFTKILIFFIILFGVKQLMEEDILNYSATVMFLGTLCIKTSQ